MARFLASYAVLRCVARDKLEIDFYVLHVVDLWLSASLGAPMSADTALLIVYMDLSCLSTSHDRSDSKTTSISNTFDGND